MKKQNFLSKLREEGKLDLVEPSDEICASYLEKAGKCLKSANLLFKHELYENSVAMSYYSMYNSLIALFFKTGIKCENHTGTIFLFKKLFNRADLFKTISFAKEERIDKQYYTDFTLTKESADDMTLKAEEFLVQIKLLMNKLNLEEIIEIRQKFETLLI